MGQEIYVQDADAARSAAEWDEVRQPRSMNSSKALGQLKGPLSFFPVWGVGGFLFPDSSRQVFLASLLGGWEHPGAAECNIPPTRV